MVDVEHSLHLGAFNQMWREFGVPWQWTRQEYAGLLGVAGGRERLARLRHDPRFRAVVDIPCDEGEWLALVGRWHRRKTEIYADRVRGADLAGRPGVRRLAHEAVAAGWRLATASSGMPVSVRAVVDKVLGSGLRDRCVVVSSEAVARRKPSPDLYLRAADLLGVPPAGCVAVEDTRSGLLSAKAAGMACVVTPVAHTLGQDFTEADLVVTTLGEPGGPAATVLAGPHPRRPWITIDDLDELAARGHEAALTDRAARTRCS